LDSINAHLRPCVKAHAAIEAAASPGDVANAAANGDGVFIDSNGLFGIVPFAIPRGPVPVSRLPSGWGCTS
jgi:hypothetical protein